MNISSISIKRPVATIMLMLMVVVVGLVSLMGIPKDLLPKIEYPVAMVITSYPNASPEEVESMITKPLEQALATVENLDQMMSMTSEGQSMVMVQFQMDTDMNFATLNMREKTALISGFLPDEAGDPTVIKMDMAAMPIVQIYASSDMPLSDLNEKIESNVVSYFERVEGVASVDVSGGVSEEVAIAFNQEKLSGYGISMSQISQMLSSENLNMPSGDITKGSSKVIVRTIGEFSSVEDIKSMPIPVADRSIVRLGDIASVSQEYQAQDSLSRMDGASAISIMITKQSDANTIAVSKDVQKTIKDLSTQFPDISFKLGMDQADYINASLSSVTSSALIGAILAIFVVFLFLKNVRTTLVIAISIPTSLLATFALMSLRGITLNLITLCSLTLAVGMLVDNSIVVLENIFRIRQNVSSAEEAAHKGSKEIFLAVIASTLTTVLVFLPIALSGGFASLMFADFCFTMIIALLSSLVVALTVVPMLSSKLLSQGLSTDYMRIGNRRYKFRYIQKFTKFVDFLIEEYDHFVRKALEARKRFIISCILVFIISISSVALVGTELLPASDEGSFSISVEMPYGTALDEKDKLIQEIEACVVQIPEMETYTANVGGGGNAMMGGGGNSVGVTLVSKKNRSRSTADIVQDVKSQLAYISGAEISITESSTMGSMMGGGVDMTLGLKGKELNELEAVGNDLCNEIKKISSVESAEIDITEGNPEVAVIINRDTAAYYGISAYQLANGLNSALAGTTATKLKVDGEEIEVNLSLSDTYSSSLDNMKQIMITGTSGLSVPVGQIANFEYGNSPSQINRLNQMRYINLNVDIDGTNLSETSNEVFSVVNNYTFPDGYYYEASGQQQEMMDAFQSLFLALVVSIALVYLLLAAQFESLRLPFIVMMSIPFAMSGAFVAMFITGTALSMTSFLGLIMLVGIVVNNAILLVEFITQNKLTMGRDEALIQAGKMRLRPILMTSLTTCVGMIPISLGWGEGGEALAPMGISIIGGMIASTLVTLFLIPVLYAVFDDKTNKRKAKQTVKLKHVHELEAAWAREDVSK